MDIKLFKKKILNFFEIFFFCVSSLVAFTRWESFNNCSPQSGTAIMNFFFIWWKEWLVLTGIKVSLAQTCLNNYCIWMIIFSSLVWIIIMSSFVWRFGWAVLSKTCTKFTGDCQVVSFVRVIVRLSPLLEWLSSCLLCWSDCLVSPLL